MSRDTLIAKYETLPVVAQKQVEAFIEFLSERTPAKPVRATKRRFKFDWAGGLSDLKGRFTAVELQPHRHTGQGLSTRPERGECSAAVKGALSPAV